MKIALAVIVVTVLGAGLYFFMVPKTQAPVVNPQTNGVGTSTPPETANPNPAPVTATLTPKPATPKATSVTISYDGSTFTPSSVTVHAGDTVTFVNKGTGPMWVSSDPHPTHQGYSGTSASQHCPDTTGTAFDECSAGSMYSFVFQKTGSWGYHNHANNTAKGTVVVQ